MATLTFDGVCYRVDGHKLELGTTLRRRDLATGEWFEGRVNRSIIEDYDLCLTAKDSVSVTLQVGDTVEIVSAALLHSREMNERNRIVMESREKPWLPFDPDGE